MIKLDIQLFGGRGASSSKTYTSKDIKTIRDEDGVQGYELNGMYLLKSYMGNYWGKGPYSWIFNYEKERIGTSLDLRRRLEKKEAFIVNNLKEGKEKLLELANKKKRSKK